MNKINYQTVMESLISEHCGAGEVPRLLLHSCCGPCSSYCIQTLSEYFRITVFYYNPNIYPPEEFELRANEQERFIKEFPTKYPVSFIKGTFVPQEFYDAVKGYEELPEGDKRCFICYELRLKEAAKQAKAGKFDFFTTTLSISPLKNSDKLNEIGKRLEEEYNIKYLYSDFKKKDGYKKSTQLSRQYEMYRQYYCGCVFSKNERDRQIAAKESEE